MSESVQCAGCGREPDPDAPAEQVPWTWSIGIDERGRRTVLCEDCFRAHARSVEAKLDPQWW